MTHSQMEKLNAYERALNSLAEIGAMEEFKKVNDERLNYVRSIAQEGRQ